MADLMTVDRFVCAPAATQPAIAADNMMPMSPAKCVRFTTLIIIPDS
jgi:hypothetical protein